VTVVLDDLVDLVDDFEDLLLGGDRLLRRAPRAEGGDERPLVLPEEINDLRRDGRRRPRDQVVAVQGDGDLALLEEGQELGPCVQG